MIVSKIDPQRASLSVYLEIRRKILKELKVESDCLWEAEIRSKVVDYYFLLYNWNQQ